MNDSILTDWIEKENIHGKLEVAHKINWGRTIKFGLVMYMGDLKIQQLEIMIV